MKRLQSIFITLGILLGVVTVSMAQPVGAINVFKACNGNSSAVCSDAKSGNGGNLSSLIQKIVNLLLFILGVIAVIMIIVGGLRYTTSGGDASQTKSAKDTILYSVVGLVIAILAYAIVNFIVKNI